MSLFTKKDSFAHETHKAEKEVISSIIDIKMVIKGELSFEGKARIDGTVEGNISGEHLILSESGKIIGDIQVTSFVCHGIMEGNIKANLVTARKSCQIHGRIESNSLTVEPGAGLSGELKVASRELHLVNKDSINSTSASEKTAKG
ncbi:MAG: polymer-forming cytoskeletal protein [Proteobacteria bacterium]|nr:polymer-forming cytoskeletal protein [Pseudomonadota bacterium]MBU1137337.1 polymer-forming cytoskeletal protein [Pseudomonadota bacterium]MBU1234174.1 polymer-forming cytoskeletal protein [Pseudomonadota bacterium]MBU1417445.1 polymer-forming cytoskeletal protein [Pseudomonadota bacterium]MBU1453134.1 polymer-forming cytoskeletal protein [Pseudomonadota bacterium]